MSKNVNWKKYRFQKTGVYILASLEYKSLFFTALITP